MQKNIVRIIWRKLIFPVPWKLQVLILNKLKEKGVNCSERHRMWFSSYYLFLKFSLKRPDTTDMTECSFRIRHVSSQQFMHFEATGNFLRAHTPKANNMQKNPNDVERTLQYSWGKLWYVKKCSSLIFPCILHAALFVHKLHDKT